MGAYGKKHNISHFSLVVDICTFACKRGKKSKCDPGGTNVYFSRAYQSFYLLYKLLLIFPSIPTICSAPPPSLI